jgi:hypothetical protein
MSEDSKSISGAMAGRVLGEEPGRQQVEEGRGDANRDGHACQDRSGVSETRLSFGAEIELAWP